MENILNLGNDKLNINTTTAKGLEKVIGIIGTFVVKAQTSVNKILYGKFKLQTSPTANKIQKALDKGITNTLSDIVGINYCDIINYLINQAPAGQQFNPENPPTDGSSFARTKWTIQKQAFEVQKRIDQYYQSYGDANNPESKLGLYSLIKEVNDIFATILSPQTGLNDPEILKTFPQTTTITNFLQDVLNKFNQYQSVNDINQAELQKLLRFIEKVRAYCTAIIGLNSPASFINFANTITDGGIQEQIAKLNKIIDVPRFLPLLRQIIRSANNINNLARKLLGYINLGRTIITICLVLIKIFNILKIFFVNIAIPSLFGTKGVDIKLNEVFQQKLKEEGEKRFIERLNQINAVLNLMAICVTTVIAGIDDIIYKLNLIKLNLEACNPGVGQEIQDTISNLTSTRTQLQDFLDRYNSTGEKINRQFGTYTIEIVTEQVVDEGISLRRRFGVARDNNGNIVVQSTPTFASLDLIIVNEVKTLLVSKGLVNFDLGNISSENSLIVLESLRFLGKDDLSLENVQFTVQDLETIREDSDALGLTNFINNLPGGKALRKKVQKMMAEQSSKLKTDLSNTDPLGRLNTNISGI